MTTRTNTRLAGFALLFYIVIGVQKAPTPGVGAVFTILTSLSALVLGVTLYAITCAQDRDIAMLAMLCRVVEGVLGAMFIPARLALQSGGTPELHAFFQSARGWNPVLGATFFAVGSMLFSWLLLRGRLIPVALAWLGVLASALLVVALPLQLTAVLSGRSTVLMWIPMAVFEVALALWFLIKGVPSPQH